MPVKNQDQDQDESEDLGNEVTEDQAAKAEKVAEQARGKDGKFAKPAGEGEEGEEKEEKEEAEEKGEKEEESKEKEEGEEKEEETEEAEEGADAKKPGRLSKRIDTITRQRNEEKDARERAERERDEANARLAALTKNEKSRVDVLREKRTQLQESIEDLRADGNRKEAAKMQGEIDDINGEISEIRSATVAGRVTSAQSEADRYNGMLDTLEGKYPIMVKGSDEYDPKFIAELHFQVESYEKNGLTPTAALARAAKLLFQEDPFTAGGKKPEAKVPLKKPTDVKKNLDAAKRTIPSGGNGKVDDTKQRLDARKLTDKQLDELSEEQEAELLGHVFVPTDD